MSVEKNYDEVLNVILQNEGTFAGFFDIIFDFLNRRSDYFKVRMLESSQIGLEIGEAEAILRNVFSKYMEQAFSEQLVIEDVPDVIPLDYVHEEVVVTSQELVSKTCAETLNQDSGIGVELSPKIPWMDPDCYNGACYKDYAWAQTLKDIDLRIKVSETVSCGKQLNVTIEKDKVCIEVQKDMTWEILKEGKLSWKINVEESTWTFVPNEHIHIYLLKLKERWWDALFVDEPKIDLKCIDASIPYEDLDSESQAKIKELMFDEEQKRMGKPTIKQSEMQNKLKEAWNAEGSPFKNQPFDPSLIEIQNF